MTDTTQADDGSWTYTCPGDQGSMCGDPNTGATFTSAGWPTKKVAEARGVQHIADHQGTPMPELGAFRAEHGLVAHPDGVRAVKP